jgi:hypothetical protein
MGSIKSKITQNKVTESVCRLDVMAGKSVFGLTSSTAELSAFPEHQQSY